MNSRQKTIKVKKLLLTEMGGAGTVQNWEATTLSSFAQKVL